MDPPLVVGPGQRIVASKARHVDVVLDDHDVPDLEVLVEAAGRVGQHHRLHPQQLEDANGQRDLEKAKAAVQSIPMSLWIEQKHSDTEALKDSSLVVKRLSKEAAIQTHLLDGVALVQVEAPLHADARPPF